jgi:hypothetical protein
MVLSLMKFTEKALTHLNSNEFSKGTREFTKNIINAASGDIVAAAEAMEFVLEFSMFIRECLFWEKFVMFMDGVFLEDDDIRKISEIFADKKEKEDYARRIIKVIDDIDIKVKITYIINLTRALLAGFITKADYYRLINAVKNTMEEDLRFLTRSIDQDHLTTNINFEFLRQNGLAIQLILSGKGDDSGDEFVFTSLARMIDKYGLKYGNEKYQYSTSKLSLSEQPVIQTKLGDVVARFG